MAGNAFSILRRHVWHPGDDPTRHPLWQDQVQLEHDMMRIGSDLFRDRVVKAKERQQLTRLKPYRNLIEIWMPDLVRGIKDYRRDSDSHYKATAGRPPLSVQLLKKVEPYQAALVTLRHVLDSASLGPSVLTVAGRIGKSLEDEARMEAWEARDPDLFQSVQRGLKAQKATQVHVRRVNINRFNKLMREATEWQDWDEGSRQQLGLSLIDILIRYTEGFRLEEELGESVNGSRAGRLKKTPVRLQMSQDVIQWLTRSLDAQEVLSPQYMPTLMPPKRWTSLRVGGYYTDYVRIPPLIKFKTIDPEQRVAAEQEYNALDFPKVYEALHTLQEVGWRINERVYDVMAHCFENDLGLAGIPLWKEENVERLPLPVKPRGRPRKDAITPPIDPNHMEAWKAWCKTPDGRAWRKSKEGIEWRRRAAPVWSRRFRVLSDVKTFRQVKLVADKMLGHTFYYPHMFDFRGRMYPIPLYLQPQGTDISRGLLTFAHGKEITAENNGLPWLCIHLANCWGVDKVSFEDRIAWVNEREEMWYRIAADPMGNLEWCAPKEKGGADSPWQALAAIFEWVSFQDHGYGYVSNLPIRVDGTCNGIQHLSAMTRDALGGAAVNLIPGDQPRDIYKEVATRLSERLKLMLQTGAKDSDKAEWWLELLHHDIPRSLTKRPVMIMPYGGTREAYYTYTRDWLLENHPEIWPKDNDPPETKSAIFKDLGSLVSFIVGPMREIVFEVASGGVAVMEWLQKCARLAAKGNQPIFWKTPAGFVVRHFYGKIKTRRIDTKIDGQRYQFVEYVPTEELDVSRQLTGIPPNFVHSLDASALMETIHRARKAGIVSITTIHDNFGAPAADMDAAYVAIREAFVETHREDVLGKYRAACLMIYAGHIAAVEHEGFTEALIRADVNMPQPLEMGSLNIEGVLTSDYFFA